MANKILGIVLSLVLVGILFGGIYSLGSSHGQAKIQVLWDADKERQAEAIKTVEKEYKGKEALAILENTKISKELREANDKYKTTLAQYQSDYSKRLLSAEGRASLYKRQADGSVIERGSLASYAAELDRNLEEGRLLVRELGATIRQRDNQIAALSAQITSDRKLFTESSTP